MKKKSLKMVSSLALATTLLASGIPFQNVAGAATVGNIAANLHNYALQSQKAQGAFISKSINTASTEKVKVIVQMSGQPTAVGMFAAKQGFSALAAQATEASVMAQQTSVISAAKSAGIKMDVSYQFTTVLNGMEVTISADQIPQLAKLPGVVSIYENKTYYELPITQESVGDDPRIDMAPLHQVGAPTVWNSGMTGEGIKIGVIDTGVDYLHPDLAPVYKGGYDAFFQDDDPYEEPPVGTFAGTSHGTHVAGTIVGHASNPTSDIVQKGVAFNAELYAYKVLGYNPATGRSSGSSAQVIDGIEHAVRQGMDIINLSLGSDGEKDPNSPDSIAVNNAVLAGVTAVIANGNAAQNGNYYYSMGSPAGAQLGISVGAVTSPSKIYASESSTSHSADPFTLNLVQWKIGHTDFDNIFGAGPVDAVYAGLGTSSDFEGVDVTGKIAFISRGSNTFADKFANAKAKGAKAVVIFNGNAKTVNGVAVPDLDFVGRDGYIGNNYGETFDGIPVFDMEGLKGRALAKAVLNDPSTPLQFDFSITGLTVPGDRMAGFSSRGPSSDGTFGIKPDVTAPGVSVMSTLPAYGLTNPNADYNKAYGRLSGTSMATPHVAGMVALIKQAHPDWTPFDIRAALANTAEIIHDENGVQYDVYSQGAGRTDVSRAIATKALLQSVENLKILDKNLQPIEVTNYNDNVSFGLMQQGDVAKTSNLQLKNVSDSQVTYSASVKMHSSVTSDPTRPVATPDVSNIQVSLSGLTDGTVTAAAKSTTPFALNVQPTANAADGVYEGEVVLEAAGEPTLHIPFVVHVGAEEPNGFGIQDINLSNTIITPNGDGVTDTTDVSFDLTATDVNYLALNVYGIDDKFVGTLEERYAKDAAGNFVKIDAGKITFKGIDGSYTDSNGTPVAKLAPGTYKLEVLAAKLDKNGVPMKNASGADIMYTMYKTLGVSDLSIDQAVLEAKANFHATVSNITALNQPVLTLPTTQGLAYNVIASDKPEYISNAGLLQNVPTSGVVTVNLTVRIASATEPSANATVTVPVKLGDVSTRPLALQQASLDRTSGLKAKVTVAQHPNAQVYSGPAVVVFQLMKGNTPVSNIAITKDISKTEEVAATFQVAGNDYSVNVFVVDSFDGSLTDVGQMLAAPSNLQ